MNKYIDSMSMVRSGWESEGNGDSHMSEVSFSYRMRKQEGKEKGWGINNKL